MKTISFELAKRLNDGGLLDNIDTEYYIDENLNIYNGIQNELCSAFDNIHRYKKLYKTLTVEEAIEFLPKKLGKNQLTVYFYLKKWVIDYTSSEFYSNLLYRKKGKTLLEAVEEILKFLLDNNLLTK